MTDTAGNGLLARRAFISSGLGGVASVALLSAGSSTAAQSSARFPGAPMSGYGQPSKYASPVVRQRIRSAPGTNGAGASATPLQQLQGTLTPNGLHFERHHSGVPDINPAEHQLVIHGEVTTPLAFNA